MPDNEGVATERRGENATNHARVESPCLGEAAQKR